MVNVRLDKTLEEKLKQYSLEENLSKSSIVKEALTQYFKGKEASKSPYKLGSDLFGLEGSGNPNASRSYKAAIKKKLSAKNSH